MQKINSVVIAILVLLMLGGIALAVYLVRQRYLEWKSGEQSYLPKDVRQAIDNHRKKLENEVREAEARREMKEIELEELIQ